MKFFNLDCHVSVIADIKKIFKDLGHEVVSWSISGHNWVFDRNSDNVDVINQSNWRQIDSQMCDQFYERYKDYLTQFDGFICTYPLSFSLLYEKFNKPIILHIPIRYEVPFENSKEKWINFNKFLIKGIENRIVFPIANSVYDKNYFEFFTKKNCDYIPNICDYTNTLWKPTQEKFLWYSKLPIMMSNDSIVNKSSLGRYKWSDISKFKGIIMIPYNCSTMSIFEFYSSNIPLFCPSINFMIELYKDYNNYVLSELCWNKLSNSKSQSIIECDITKDPNNYLDIEIMKKWIELSDFYNEEWMPHIVYFESFEDLEKKIKDSDLFGISEKMKEFNQIRKNNIHKMWENKLKDIYE